MTLTLDPHQIESVAHLLANPRGGLGDEMRVGKTAPSIVAAIKAKARHVLVLCPPAPKSNWVREIKAWTEATDPSSTTTWEVESYDTFWRRDIGDQCKGWDTIILDEVHYLRNHTTKRGRAVWGPRANGNTEVLKDAERVWALSGTPMVNNATDLWAMFHALGWTELTLAQWTDRYCYTRDTQFGIQVTGNRPEAIRELRKSFRQYFVRRTFAEVHKGRPEPLIWRPVIFDAPKVSAELAKLEADPKVAALRAKLMGSEDEDILSALRVIEGQVSSIRRVTAELKVPLTVAHVEEYLVSNPRAKVLILGWHEEPIQAIVRGLARYGALAFTGKTRNRDQVIAAFQNDPRHRAFTGNIVACGTGIDLSAADAVVMHETLFTPGDNAQAAMRPVNRNKTAPVPVDVVGLAGTIDEGVARTVARKMQMMTDVYANHDEEEQ